MQRGQSHCHASSRRHSSQAVRLKKAGAAPGKDGSPMLGKKSTTLPRFGHSRRSAVGPETAALRDFSPAFVRFGSKADKALITEPCPLCPPKADKSNFFAKPHLNAKRGRRVGELREGPRERLDRSSMKNSATHAASPAAPRYAVSMYPKTQAKANTMTPTQ